MIYDNMYTHVVFFVDCLIMCLSIYLFNYVFLIYIMV